MGSRNTLQVSNVPEISHPSELSFHEEPLWAVSSANTSRGESVLQAAVKEAQQKQSGAFCTLRRGGSVGVQQHWAFHAISDQMH